MLIIVHLSVRPSLSINEPVAQLSYQPLDTFQEKSQGKKPISEIQSQDPMFSQFGQDPYDNYIATQDFIAQLQRQQASSCNFSELFKEQIQQAVKDTLKEKEKSQVLTIEKEIGEDRTSPTNEDTVMNTTDSNEEDNNSQGSVGNFSLDSVARHNLDTID